MYFIFNMLFIILYLISKTNITFCLVCTYKKNNLWKKPKPCRNKEILST